MNWISLPERFGRSRTTIKKVLDPGQAEAATTGAAGWYAGLALDPAEFSQQLCNMQLSLQQANTAGAVTAGAELVMQKLQAEREFDPGT